MKNKFLIMLLVLILIINTPAIFFFLKPNITGNTILENNFSEETITTPTIKKEIIETGFVSRIKDGDTVVINGENVRLLGINTDEKGYPCYKEAKTRLEELILDKEVQLIGDNEDKDQYQRYLRYIILDKQNINLQLVQEGLAIAMFFPENQKYKTEILEAEKNARENKMGCKWENLEDNNQKNDNNQEFPIQEETLEEAIDPDSNTIHVCNTQKYYGQEKTVQGRVSGVFKSNTNTVFINFENPYPRQCFTAVIFSSLLNNFPDYEDYEYKTIRITGTIEEYQGKPEIILKERRQVEVV